MSARGGCSFSPVPPATSPIRCARRWRGVSARPSPSAARWIRPSATGNGRWTARSPHRLPRRACARSGKSASSIPAPPSLRSRRRPPRNTSRRPIVSRYRARRPMPTKSRPSSRRSAAVRSTPAAPRCVTAAATGTVRSPPRGSVNRAASRAARASSSRASAMTRTTSSRATTSRRSMTRPMAMTSRRSRPGGPMPAS